VPPPEANISRIGGLAAMIRPDATSMIAAGSGALATASVASAARPSERSGSWSLSVCIPPERTEEFVLARQRGSPRHTVDFPLMDGKNDDVQMTTIGSPSDANADANRESQPVRS
jgi:hypothetical protein